MTTATTDTRQRLAALEQEKADYSAELRRTRSRLDVLRREARESGPSAARSQVVRDLEADEVRLSGVLAQVEEDHTAALVSQRNEENAVRRSQNAAVMAAHREQLRRRAEAMLTVRAAFLVLQDALFQAHAVNAETMTTGRQAREAARDTAILDGLDPAEIGLEMLTAVSGVLGAEKLTAEDCGHLALPVLPVLAWRDDWTAARTNLLAELEAVK